jgi:hypothetical protein
MVGVIVRPPRVSVKSHRGEETGGSRQRAAISRQLSATESTKTKKVPGFNVEAPSADLEGTWACFLFFPYFLCHIASLDMVIMTG